MPHVNNDEKDDEIQSKENTMERENTKQDSGMKKRLLEYTMKCLEEDIHVQLMVEDKLNDTDEFLKISSNTSCCSTINLIKFHFGLW